MKRAKSRPTAQSADPRGGAGLGERVQAGNTVQRELHADLGGRGEGGWWDVGVDRSGGEALRGSSWSVAGWLWGG